jgi:Ca-activated chloride channel homolog
MPRSGARTKGKFLRVVGLAAVVSALLSLAPARRAGAAMDGGAGQYTIPVNVSLVVLPVSVTNGKGNFVSGLHSQDFRVYENGLLQQITFFEPEDVPVTIGLVIDSSSSMASKRREVIAASLGLVQSSNPQDEVFVVNFNQRVSFGLPRSVSFTSNLNLLRDALSRTQPAGNTALYDAIAASLHHLKAGTGERKALVVVTDGSDNTSHVKFPDLLREAEASSSVIYAIGIFDQNYVDSPKILRQLAKATGGEAYFPESLADISDTALQIAADIRKQYTIGYPPANRAPDGKLRLIRVRASAAGAGKLRVRTRSGYLIPQEPQSAVSASASSSGL